MWSRRRQRQRALDVLLVADLSAATMAGASDVSAGATLIRVRREKEENAINDWIRYMTDGLLGREQESQCKGNKQASEQNIKQTGEARSKIVSHAI